MRAGKRAWLVGIRVARAGGSSGRLLEWHTNTTEEERRKRITDETDERIMSSASQKNEARFKI